MILSDKDNLFIEHGAVEKMIKSVGIGGAGLYITIKASEYDNPDGVKEIKILGSSSDGIKVNKFHLEKLIKEGFVERTEEGLIKATLKRFD